MATTPSDLESVLASFASMANVLSTVNHDSSETTNYVELIQTVIASLEQTETAMVNHREDQFLWKFQYGSVEVLVQLTGQSNEDTFTVWATVLSLPVKDELTLLRRLLEMNWTSTLEARFGILDNQIVAITQRSVADLSAGEISRAITIVATLADEQDDLLKAEFGL